MHGDDEQILISAVRYCIGRMSYIVGSCDRWLRERWDGLSLGCRDTILKDIWCALERDRLGHASIGMNIDRDTWAALYRDLSPRPSGVADNAPAQTGGKAARQRCRMEQFGDGSCDCPQCKQMRGSCRAGSTSRSS